MGVNVKICGLRHGDQLADAVSAGARYIGFNFFPPSPRHVSPTRARDLALAIPPGIAKVALVVDAEDALLEEIAGHVPLDMIQLHGREAPERVRAIRARFGLPVMKVVGVADAGDLAAIADYEAVADQILLDAKPPRDAVLPGGNGLSFDWRLIAGREWRKPWMLAGGLTPANVGEAVARTGARQVDVASGVESAPGEKDATLMRDFIRAAQC